MEDKFKAFVAGNRDEFENYDLDLDQSWSQIADGIQNQQEKQSGKKVIWFKIAASVAILIMFSAGMLYWGLGAKKEETLFAANPELAEAQAYYTSQIAYKMSLAQSKPGGEELFRDIEELDKAFADLKNDLKDNADNEEVIIAMIENYQLKLKILDRLLKELQEEEQGS